MTDLNRISPYLLSLCTTALVTACGGGGGTKANNTTQDTPAAIQWTDRSTEHYVPAGVQYQVANINGADAHLVTVDLNQSHLQVEAVKAEQAQAIFNYTFEPGVVVAINGGFFSGNSSYSAVINQGEVLARNITALNRNGQSYPVIRSTLTLDSNNQASIEWLYHFEMNADGGYVFDAPLAYAGSSSAALAAPEKANGTPIAPRMAIGGGPMLIKNGVERLTYNEEIFWGSGVELNDQRPRTAVCVTNQNHLRLLVISRYALQDLPALLLDLDCTEAMNLDGGGSSAMAFNDQAIYDQGRAVPTALVIKAL